MTVLKAYRREIAVISLIVGVLIIVKPDLLGLLVGLYLIITGALSLLTE